MKIGYARVSSKGQNLDMQIDSFKTAGCEKILVEKQSAFKERPELQKTFDILRPGDILFVWALDRLGRTMLEILQNVKLLNDKNVSLKITSLNVDTSTPSGKILIWAFGLLAELENDLRKQRQREGIEAAKSRGRTGGRPKGLSEEAKKKAYPAEKMDAYIIKNDFLKRNPYDPKIIKAA